MFPRIARTEITVLIVLKILPVGTEADTATATATTWAAVVTAAVETVAIVPDTVETVQVVRVPGHLVEEESLQAPDLRALLDMAMLILVV